MDIQLIDDLSREIRMKVEEMMQEGKEKRMEGFSDEEGNVDPFRLLAFALTEAKLYTTLYTTEFYKTLADYEVLDDMLKQGITLKQQELESEKNAEQSN